jgi:prolycopene isomerase
MSIRRESLQEAYDLIVVGSGMGGLSAAALLAQEDAGGRRPERPGGYARAFQRKHYLFDAAVHQIGRCEPMENPRASLIDRFSGFSAFAIAVPF